MLKLSLKTSLLSTAILCSAGFSGASMAHNAPGLLPNDQTTTGLTAETNAPSAVDVYHTSCFTWNSNQTQAPGESATAAKRFVANVSHRCSTLNATCNVDTVGSKVRVSIGSPFGNNPTAGIWTATGAAANGSGVLLDNSVTPNLWVDGSSRSTWVQTADTLGADANGTYTVAVSHKAGVKDSYIASFHCENVAVGASPAPDSSPSIHTGTGVNNGANPGSYVDVPNNSSTTAADYNQYIDQ